MQHRTAIALLVAALACGTAQAAAEQIPPELASVRRLERDVVAARKAGGGAELGKALAYLCAGRYAARQLKPAEAACREALPLVEKYGPRKAAPGVHAGLAQVLKDRGDADGADAAQLRAIGLYDAQKRAAEAAAARINLFNWRLERGQAEPARQVVIPAIRWHEAELKAGRGDIRLLRNLYWQYGSASRSLGKLEQAGKLYLGALGLAQRQQDKTAEAEIREELGSLYHEQKNDQASLEQYDAALQLNVALGNTQQQAFDHANAGLALAGLGQHEQAIGRFRLALPVLAAAREDEVVARVRMALGTSLEAVDRRAEALPEYQQAVALRRRLPDRTALAESLQALGTGLRHLDRDVAAVPVLEEVARLWRELGRPAEESLAANSLGAALELLDRPEDALRWRERVLQLDLSAGPQAAGDVADARRVIARSLQALGRQPEALAQLQQALDWYLAEHAAGRSTNTVALRLLYRGISDLQASLGRHADALEPRRQALALAGALGDRSGEADDLHEYGGLLGRLRQTAEAVAQFDAEIALRRALGDLPGEADANIGAAIALAMTWDEAGATARYRQAIELVRKAGDPEAEAQDRMLFGMMLRQFGHLEAARQEFATALALVAARTETELTRSAAEQGLGNLSADAGHGAEAFARYEAALRLAIAADSIGQRLRVERDIAYLAADRGDVTGAVARLRRALVLARAHDWGGQQGMARYYEADLQVQLAFRLVDQGQLDLAQQQIDAAQAVARNSGDPFLQTAALTAQGSVLLQRGRYAEAIATYESTLALPGNAGDDLLRDGVLNNVGLAQAAAGRYDEALASHLQVLQSRRARGDRWSEMISLDNLATVMLKLGQPAQAEQFAIEGQALAAQLESRDYEARLRRSQADARARLGRIDEARADYRASVRIARSVGIPEVEADGWLGSGYLERDHGRPAAAIDAFARALERYRRAGVRYGEAEALASLAALEAGRGRNAQARVYAQQALALAGEIGAPDLLWRCWDALAVAAERQGQVEQAIFYRKQAVNAVQGLRAGLTRLDKELQRSLLDDKAPVYRGLADDLIGLGRLAEAEQVMAMLKEEEYFDFVRRDAASDARRTTLPASAAEAPWAQRYAAINDRVVALGQEYQSLRAIPAEQRTPEQQARFAAVKADLDVARAAFNAYLTDIDQAFKAEGGQRRDAYAAQNLDSLRAQQATLGRLGAGAVLVHYLVMPDKLHILVTTRGAQLHREVKTGAVEINRLVFQYRDILQAPTRDPLPAAQALYQALIAPIAADLAQADARTLMLSLDGSLRYLPFAALHDGKDYLVARYGFSLYTPAGRGALERAPQAAWRIAGLGVSRGAEGWSPLPAVPVELDEIVRSGPDDPAGILPGRTLLDDGFSAEALAAALEDSPPVVHIASHFNFTSGTDVDSYLLLGGGAHLTLADLKAGNYPFGGVDLLTLSACQTALGGGTAADGREVEGFGALAQNEGAAAVMATLWSVADGSTGLFMREFYRRRQEAHLSKAGAMREVQLAFLSGELRPDTAPVALRGAMRAAPAGEPGPKAAPFVPPPGAPFAHPFYWAPFLLMGNWL